MRRILPFIVLVIIVGCGKDRPDGNTMRAAFLTTLQLTAEAKEIQKQIETNPENKEKAYSEVTEKTESAYAMALSVDEGFLRWLDPGLPSAFGNLKNYLKLKSQRRKIGSKA